METKTLQVWHGTGTGADDAVLNSIREKGFSISHSNAVKHMQGDCVYFTTSKPWAIAYALRLVKPDHPFRRQGAPLVASVAFDAGSPDWDIDYEYSYRAGIDFLKLQGERLQVFPANRVRVVVTKGNVAFSFPNASAAEKDVVVADWLLEAVKMSPAGPVLHFRDSLANGAQRLIGIDWESGEVKGVNPLTGSFANLLGQMTAYYRAENPAQFRDFLAAKARTEKPSTDRPAGLALRYTGTKPLPATSLEINRDGVWATF